MKLLDGLINAIGAMAEMAAMYYKTLIKSGIPEKVATELTSAYIATMASNAMNHGNHEKAE